VGYNAFEFVSVSFLVTYIYFYFVS